MLGILKPRPVKQIIAMLHRLLETGLGPARMANALAWLLGRPILGNLPYRPLDVPAGVAKLQLLGVRYYMAVSSQAKEQAAGIDQVNTAMSQMGQVTQRNAAMAIETTNASDVLERATTELSRMVASFEVADTSSIADRSAPRSSARPAAAALGRELRKAS